jgi:hypothetical protein
MTRITAEAVVLVALTTAAAAAGASALMDIETVGPEQVGPRHIGGGIDAYRVQFADGVRCVVTVRGSTHAVACDWPTQEKR